MRTRRRVGRPRWGLGCRPARGRPRAAGPAPPPSRPGRRRRRGWAGVLLLLALCLWTVISFERNLAPLIVRVAEVRAQAWAIEVMSRIITEEIIPGLTYEDLVRLERDTSGRIVFMQPDALELNRVMARAVEAIQEELRHSEQFRVMVPLNQALGTVLFMNVGPRVTAYVTAVGTVHGEISEEFSEAGINQTRHAIFLQLRAQMSIVIPLVRYDSEVSTKLALVQAVIVGDVPHTYVRIGR